ncbi:MAG: hypothetical protein FVQ85_00100 [Planctomycetes bacterium]|nr:hypothetical protein [Planctomycetota bacterium]
MNVSAIITRRYGNKTNWTLGENEPKTNPIKANLQKAQMFVTTFLTKYYENILNLTLFENKANKMPKQTQFKAKQSQFQRQKNAALHLFAVGCRTEKIIMLFKSLSGKCQLVLAVLPDNIN